jgi:hypothetical protein
MHFANLGYLCLFVILKINMNYFSTEHKPVGFLMETIRVFCVLVDTFMLFR